MKRTELGIDVGFLLSVWSDALRPPPDRKGALRKAIVRGVEACGVKTEPGEKRAAPKPPDVAPLSAEPAAFEPSTFEWWERLADRVGVALQQPGDGWD